MMMSIAEPRPLLARAAQACLQWRKMLAVGLTGAALAVSAMAPIAASAQGLPDFTELVERVGPAVVNIRTTERMRAPRAGGGGGGPELDEDMLEFFRRFGIPIPGQPNTPGPRRGQPQPDSAEPQQRGVGSGFILSADGFVLTNAHVVEGAEDVTVTLTDKREFKARVIGSDKRTDVALVKIEAASLPFVRIGDVSRLKVGEWVMAIGSPFGLDNTVTAGIVSAKARDTGEFLPFIQTDVAINPGNSGGPLINMRGEVVGINSQIYSRSGGFMGISFAIPIDEAVRVSDQLRTSGRVVRGRIGVQISPVTKDVAESIGLGKAGGALVQAVEAGGPADKGGVEAGDIITKVDGKVVDKSGDLPRVIGNTKPGQKVTLQVFRRGAYKESAGQRGRVRSAHHDRGQALCGTGRWRQIGPGDECAGHRGVRLDRCAKARVEGEVGSACRERRGRSGSRWCSRRRCGPGARQHRDYRRQAVRSSDRQTGQDETGDGSGAAWRVGQLCGDQTGCALKEFVRAAGKPSDGAIEFACWHHQLLLLKDKIRSS